MTPLQLVNMAAHRMLLLHFHPVLSASRSALSWGNLLTVDNPISYYPCTYVSTTQFADKENTER